MNNEEANAPNESDVKIERRHREFTREIWRVGNQVTANLFGEVNIKQNPNPVIKVPNKKNS